jgi:hypothetical protein
LICHSKSDYQFINPTNQITLSSSCLENCSSSIENIQWNVYKGLLNSLFNIIEWTPTNADEARWFYGKSKIFNFPLISKSFFQV